MNNRISIISFFVGLIIILTSCANINRTVYKEVKIPVTCQVEIPKHPLMTEDTVLNTIELITFTKHLEELLKVCIKQ